VETISGQGGKIFRVRWKPFRGKVESNSWIGGKNFRAENLRRKLFHGKGGNEIRGL